MLQSVPAFRRAQTTFGGSAVNRCRKHLLTAFICMVIYISIIPLTLHICQGVGRSNLGRVFALGVWEKRGGQTGCSRRSTGRGSATRDAAGAWGERIQLSQLWRQLSVNGWHSRAGVHTATTRRKLVRLCPPKAPSLFFRAPCRESSTTWTPESKGRVCVRRASRERRGTGSPVWGRSRRTGETPIAV